MTSFTFNNDDTIWSVWPQFIGSNDLVLSGIAGLSIDDLNRNDTIRVGDWELGRVKLFASLQPFDLDMEQILFFRF